ncbi:hypothetical protein [Peribacillus simplex]|nr:hypothetical protein [Peribacillus simplex]
MNKPHLNQSIIPLDIVHYDCFVVRRERQIGLTSKSHKRSISS